MGDKQVVWDPKDEAEVMRAQGDYDALSNAGFHIYNEGKAMPKFDAKAGYFLATVEPLDIPAKPAAKAKATAKVKEV